MIKKKRYVKSSNKVTGNIKISFTVPSGKRITYVRPRGLWRKTRNTKKKRDNPKIKI